MRVGDIPGGGNSSVANITSGSITGLTTFTVSDSVFTLQDNVDPTKQGMFQLSGITAGQTRTLSFPDASGTMLYAGGPLGTPASGVLTSATGLPIATGLTGGATNAIPYFTSATAQAADGTNLTWSGTILQVGSGNTTNAGVKLGYSGTSSYGVVSHTNTTPSTSIFAMLIGGAETYVGGGSSGLLMLCGGVNNPTIVTINGTTAQFAANKSLALASVAMTRTAPTIASGFGTSPSISASNGTAAFTLTIGTSTTGVQTGTITMPAATTGWVCTCQNVTNPDSFVVSQTGGSTTTIALKNYSRTTGLAADFTASDVIRIMAMGY